MTAYRRVLLALVVVLLAAFALRVSGLGAQGIWGDEAFSVAVGKLALRKIVEGGRDTHPPLFHALLHYWLRAAGDSEFSVRFPALMAGLLMVPAAFVVARRLLNWQSAVVAAALIGFSPFAVYYSQEARMYSQAALFTTLSVYGFLRLCDSSEQLASPKLRPLARWQAIYLAATLLGMYSHYYVFFVIAAQNVSALWRWRKRPRWLAWWIGSQALLAILYLPWVFAQIGYLSGKANRRWDAWGPSGMVDVWVNTIHAFAVGAVPLPDSQLWALALTALAFAGLAFIVFPNRWQASRHRLFAAAYFLLPLLIAWGVGPIMPFFYERFLLPILPAYATLIAACMVGLWTIRRELAALALALVVAAQAPGLAILRRSPEADKSNYREIIAYISAHAHPDDGLLLLNPEQDALFAYYGGQAPLAYWFPPPEGWDSPENQQRMAEIERQRPRVWLILFGNAREWDFGGNLQNWLNERAFRAYHADYVDGALELYVIGDLQPDTGLIADFDGVFRLTRFGVSANSTAPGDTIQVALEWEALQKPDKDYTIFTHIVDSQQRIVGQFDGQPGAGTHPTSQWRPGERVVERMALQIDPSAPPGEYWLEVGWYDLATLERLPTFDQHGSPLGDRVLVIPIVVR